VSRTRTTAVALFVLFVTFVAGVLVGIVGDRIAIRHRGLVPDFATHVLVRRLDRALDLSDHQRDQLTKIIDRRHSSINALFNGVRPRVREEIEAANREIEAILTPEQRVKYGKLKMRAHFAEHADQIGRGQTAPTR
jgi:hypothetical protein